MYLQIIAALLSTFVSAVKNLDEMIKRSVNGVVCSDEPTDMYHLTLQLPKFYRLF